MVGLWIMYGTVAGVGAATTSTEPPIFSQSPDAAAGFGQRVLHHQRQQQQQQALGKPRREELCEEDDDDVPWEASAVGSFLQLLLWVGAWGLVDTTVWKIAPDRASLRFALYSTIACIGGFAVPPLAKAQWKRTRSEMLAKQRAPHQQFASHTSSPQPPFVGPGRKATSAAPMVLGFPIAVMLCSGFWGMIDSLVEAYSGERVDLQFACYVMVVTFASVGVALHHNYWPHQVLDSVGQLTVV